MGCLRPATPGFVVTLIATGLLAAVSFCVPWIQSVYFLKASFTSGDASGSITFGTLGYCLQLSNGTTCSKPTIGYELDINRLVGNRLPVSIPQVVVKWLTYALFLHVVAFVLAAGSALFGLLAHVREMAMTCFSTCISGFAAVVTLIAFIFDIALFFVAKARINKVPGGSATIGNAIWFTLVSWILLFFSGCFYTLGRCCISNRGPSSRRWNRPASPTRASGPSNHHDEQLRLDAVKAEADRKARQEIGLPAFSESQPLTARIEGDDVVLDDKDSQASLRDHQNLAAGAGAGYGRRPSQPSQSNAYRDNHPGYVQGAAGGRAVDEYYAGQRPGNSYPPRRPSMTSSVSNYSAPSRTPSAVAYNSTSTIAPPPQAPAPSNQYLSPYRQYNSQPRYADVPASSQYPSYAQPEVPPQNYGHMAGGSSYHSALTHQQYPTQYSQQDVYDAYESAPAPTTNPYTGGLYTPSPPQQYQSPYLNPPQPQHQRTQDRSYTLGGDGYGSNTVPPLHDDSLSVNSFLMYPGDTHPLTTSPPPIRTDLPPSKPSNTSPVKGPRAPRSPTYDDNPPGYESGPSQPPGAWGSKR